MFGETHIFYVKIWGHPTDSQSFFQCVFRVPGLYFCFLKKLKIQKKTSISLPLKIIHACLVLLGVDVAQTHTTLLKIQGFHGILPEDFESIQGFKNSLPASQMVAVKTSSDRKRGCCFMLFWPQPKKTAKIPTVLIMQTKIHLN